MATVGGRSAGPRNGAGGAGAASGASGATERPQRTTDGIEVKRVYRAGDVPGDPASTLGDPGDYPFTRGVYPTMYRGRLWTMRQYAGFGTATGPITVQAPILRISKTASPESVSPGSELEYTIIYTNAGSVTAQNVVITDTYPTGTTYNLASPQPTSGNNVWSIGSVVPGGSAAIVVSLQVTDSMPVGSVLTNVVKISADKTAAAVTLSTGETIRAENKYFTRKDGSIFPVSYVSSPIIEEGAVTGIALAFQDITERRNLERQSRDFFAMVSHDLKSPISVIHGYTELLSSDKAGLLDAEAYKALVGR